MGKSRRLRPDEVVDGNGYIRRQYYAKDDAYNGLSFLLVLIFAVGTIVWFVGWIKMHWQILAVIVASISLLSLGTYAVFRKISKT